MRGRKGAVSQSCPLVFPLCMEKAHLQQLYITCRSLPAPNWGRASCRLPKRATTVREQTWSFSLQCHLQRPLAGPSCTSAGQRAVVSTSLEIPDPVTSNLNHHPLQSTFTLSSLLTLSTVSQSTTAIIFPRHE